jgi:hypothetical protein
MPITVPKYRKIETHFFPKSGKVTARSARISPCGKYRYLLRREWSPLKADLLGRRVLTFVLLNPSTADHQIDDPTVRRCMRFAERDEFNALQVVNLFAYRCTFPHELALVEDPIGPENDMYITDACREATRIVVGWGSAHSARNRIEFIERLPERLAAGMSFWCLGTNADGSPKHPLYVPGNTGFIPYVCPRGRAKAANP